MAHFFITGTDTDIGKTYAACTLIHALRQRFPTRRIAAMKPIAAGTDAEGRNDDVEQLKAASNVSLPPELLTPYLFAEPIAPHIAAQMQGVHIDIGRVLQNFAATAARADQVIVEGVGGFRVPLNQHEDTADLAVALNLPIILVIGLRLGCLNQALLGIEAIERRGLILAGWVANAIDPTMTHAEANLNTLRSRLHAPMLAHLPFDQKKNTSHAAIHWQTATNTVIFP